MLEKANPFWLDYGHFITGINELAASIPDETGNYKIYQQTLIKQKNKVILQSLKFRNGK